MGFLNYPFNTAQLFDRSIAIKDDGPAAQYLGTESGAIYYEDRELGGYFFRAQNATYNEIAQQWTPLDITKPAYASVIAPDGSLNLYYAAAGQNPISWTNRWSIPVTGPTITSVAPTIDMSAIGIFNVKHYGAVGDGVTDDYAAIQAAENLAEAVSGALYFPNAGGEAYMTSKPIIVQAPITICGDYQNAATIRILPAGYPNFNELGIFSAQGGAAFNVHVRDLILDCNSRNADAAYHVFNTKYGSGINAGHNWLIERVWFTDDNAFGIALEGADNVVIDNCRWSSVNGAWNDGITGGFGSKAIRIKNCWWDSTYWSRTTAIDQTDSFSMYIDNCLNQSTSPFIVEGVQQGHCRGCIFTGGESGSGSGCHLWLQSDYLYGHATVTNTSDFTVQGNTFIGGGYIFVRLASGSFVSPTPTNNQAIGIDISGNLIDSSVGPGIIWACDNTTTSNGAHLIRGNRIYNANANNNATYHIDFGTVDTSGINVFQSAGRLSVIHNTIIDNRGSPQQVHAIQFGRNDAAPTTPNGVVFIEGNYCLGASSGKLITCTNMNGAMPTIRNNPGFNPVAINDPGFPGITYPPAVPASTAALQNPYGMDAWVYITGGTVSHIAINGNNTGMTSGPVFWGAQDTIKLTYSAAPTWIVQLL